MSFDIAAYLERIGLATRPPMTLDGLRTLQAAQLSSIAFENLEPMLGSPPDLSAAGIWNKLVVAGRGGTALQLNGLLGAALEALGFPARPLIGWIRLETPLATSHLAWRVFVDGRNWLVDAGLGDHGPFTPILESSTPQASSGAMFRVIADGTGAQALQRKTDESWMDLYAYRNSSPKQVVVESAKRNASQDIQSPCSADVMVSIHRPNGRLSIINSFAKTEADFGTRIMELPTAEAFARTIQGTFKLNYSAQELRRVWTSMRRSHELHATGMRGPDHHRAMGSAAHGSAPGDARSRGTPNHSGKTPGLRLV